MKSFISYLFLSFVLASLLLFGILGSAFAQAPIFSQQQVDQATAIQAVNEDELMDLPGVHGVGIGQENGELGILILVDDQSGESQLPAQLETIPVIVREVGTFRAHQINLGVSGGNDILCDGFCDVGTVGYKVCDNTTVDLGGWISNNHVVASGCPGKCPNLAPLGTNTFSPGLVDNTPVCTTTGATNVGTLNRFVTFNLDSPTTMNLVDAAFVQSTDAQVSDNIQGLGLQSNTVVAPFVGQVVCKSGRTSGVTCGTVTGINMTVDIGYDTCGTARFINQVIYSPTAPDTTMSLSGDSGSPVVDVSNNAVALNFAGNDVDGIGNPMGTVLTQLGVSLCSDIPEPPTADANGPYGEECQGATTTVQLDGTGSSDPDPGEGDTLSFSWTTDCPGGVFDDSTIEEPTLTVDTGDTCQVVCSVELTVTDTTGQTDSNLSNVTIEDTTAPDIVCPDNLDFQCVADIPDCDPTDAAATDVCDTSPGTECLPDVDNSGSGCTADPLIITRTYEATDMCENSDSCDQTIEVVDDTAPVIDCNAPATITPPDAPISFTASATDNCSSASCEITGFDCFKFTKKGKRIDKTESCEIGIDGGTITILDSGGVGDNIDWTAVCTDACGNQSEVTCEVDVIKPN